MITKAYVYNITWKYSLQDIIKNIQNKEKLNDWCLSEFNQPFSMEILNLLDKDRRKKLDFQKAFLPELPECIALNDVSPFDTNDIDDIMFQIGDALSDQFSFTVENFDLAGIFNARIYQRITLSFYCNNDSAEINEEKIIQAFIDTYNYYSKGHVNVEKIYSHQLTKDLTADGTLYSIYFTLIIDDVEVTSVTDAFGYPSDKTVANCFLNNVSQDIIFRAMSNMLPDLELQSLTYLIYPTYKKDIIRVDFDW